MPSNKRKWLALWSLLLIVGLVAVPAIAQEQQREAINLEAINSPYSDLAPIIAADGDALYFTSDRPGGVGQQDFWMSERVGGEWTDPVNLRELNTPQNEGPDSLTPDEKTMYYTACNRLQDESDKCDIYVTHRAPDGRWMPGENLGPPINTENEEANGCISPDGRTLYFTSDRKGGQGGYDLWMSALGPNGKWGEPKNMGPTINTSMWEGIAFVRHDDTSGREVLYFSSNGHGGFGNADIFMSVRKTDGSWGEPENMGGLVNSDYNDIYFTFPASGDYIYFSSSVESGFGKEDIYALAKKWLLESKDYVIVRGTVKDATTDAPLAAMLTTSGGPFGAIRTTSSPRNGNFTLRLKVGGVYQIRASAEGYIDGTETVDLRNADPFTPVIRHIKLRPVLVTTSRPPEALPPEGIEELLFEGGRLVVQNVLFDFDKYNLKQEAVPILEQLVGFLNNNPGVILKVDGYTDSFGPPDYNMRLSIKRANAIKEYFILRGIPDRRIRTEGRGEANLIVQDDLALSEGNPANRRAEFSLVRGTYRPTQNPNTTMMGKQPPEVVLQVASLAPVVPGSFIMPSEIEVRRSAVAADMVDREPLQVGRQFSSTIGRLYFFNRVVGAVEDTQVTHVWYYRGRVVRRIQVNIKSPDYRTWSFMDIQPEWSGPMRVECYGPDGSLLTTIRFTITE